MSRTSLLNTAFLVGLTAAATAANIAWDGGGDGTTFDLATNWAGDVLPDGTIPDTAVFDGTAAGVLSLIYTGANPLGNTLGLDLSVAATQTSGMSLDSGVNVTSLRLNQLSIASGAGAFQLGDGADAFNITLGSADGQIHAWTNESAATATIASDVVLGLGGAGNHALSFGGSGNWNVASPMTPSNGAQLSVHKTGTGELELASGGSLSGGVTAYGGAFCAVLKEGVTRLTGGELACNSGELVVGGLDTGTGTDTELIVDGGSLTGFSWLSVGRGNGAGGVSSDVVINNGMSVSGANASIGFHAGDTTRAAKGSITLHQASTLSLTGTLNLGESTGDGTLTLNDGSVLNANFIDVATGQNNTQATQGTLNVNSGSIVNCEGDFRTGYAGSASNQAVVNVNGGTVNVATTTERWMIVARYDSTNSTINIDNGGTLNLNANTDLKFAQSGNVGTNVFNLNSGTVTGFSDNKTTPNGNSNIDLQLAGGTASVNTFNLNGGVLTIREIYTSQNTGTASFNFNGGTLKANATHAAFLNLGGANQRANVRDGGAIIHTNGFDVTIPEPLVHSPIDGDAAIDGGLTKLGTGSLTLSGAETYTGPTSIEAGTMTMGGTPTTSQVSVVSGASLGVEDPIDTLGVLEVPALNLASGATLRLETSSGNLSEEVVVTGAGGLTLGSAAVQLTLDDSTNGAVSGTYTILEYSGTLNGSVTNLSVANPRPGYSYDFADTGTAVTVTVVASDTDGDGMDDDWEDANGLNKLVNDADGNADGDFSTNLEEYLADTDPQDAADDPGNLDNDGLPDAWEVDNFGSTAVQAGTDDFDGDYDTNAFEYANGTDPNLATDYTDSDSDTMGDGWEIAHFGDITTSDGTADTDSDLFTDLQEWTRRTDPTDAAFSPAFARLDHRWNFNGDLLDTGTVGGSDAVIQPGDTDSTNVVTQTATTVDFTGGAKANSQWVQLGSDLLPETNEPVTLEFWATYNAVQNWSRIFSFYDPAETVAEELYMSWSVGTGEGSDRIEWLDSTKNDATMDNSISYFTGSEYHIVMVIEPLEGNPESSKATWYAATSGDAELGVAKGTFTVANRIADVSDAVNALGRSWWPDNAPSASYNEVRMFRGKLAEWALEAMHGQGPDDPAQKDVDGGAGADGLPDAWEEFYFSGDFSYGPNDDPDNDTATNLEELYAGSDPSDNTSFPGDSDADGLPDQWELDYFGSLDEDEFGDPDGDFAYNIDEYLAGTDPNQYFSFPDSDNDGMSDGWEDYWFGDLSNDGTTDTDGDSFNELAEFEGLSDPEDPLSPGVPSGDADGDGLPDRWEVNALLAVSLADTDPNGDDDSDTFTNLEEYQATSDPLDELSTPSDVDGDGEADVVAFYDLESTGTGLVDIDGEATLFTDRLGGSGTAIATPDDRLDLDTVAGTLTLISSPSDINGQINMEQLEAIGIRLSDYGFTGTEDFRIRAHFVDLPAMDGYDQIGAYVGTSTQSVLRAGTIAPGYSALGVNTNGTNDSDATFGAANSAGAVGTDLSVLIERIGGVWTVFVNDNAANPGAQPAFLDGNGDLEAGVFVLHQTTAKAATLESFTVVRFGQSNPDGDGDGIDDAWEIAYFGSVGVIDGSGDADGDGVSDLEEYAFHGDPTDGSSLGEGSISTADSNGNSLPDLTLTIAVRAGATFGLGSNQEQTATVNGVVYTVRGSLDLSDWTGGVSHVGTSASTSEDYELHTFRLDSSDGLTGRGFLDAEVEGPNP